MRQKAPARNDRESPNIFGSPVAKPNTRAKKGKYRNVMRVGGRKVSAAPNIKTKYNFPVIVTTISEAKSAAVEENNSSVPDVNRLMEKQRDFE